MKSKKTLFNDLAEINPDKFNGVNLESNCISNETYGRDSMIYISCDSLEYRNKVERELKKRGHKIQFDYDMSGSRTAVQVTYFKGWHWNE